VPLDRGRLLAFPFLSGLLVEFPATEFRQDTGLFTGALETTQGGVEILVSRMRTLGIQTSSWTWAARVSPGKGPEL
jgi:hypothetical protein